MGVYVNQGCAQISREHRDGILGLLRGRITQGIYCIKRIIYKMRFKPVNDKISLHSCKIGKCDSSGNIHAEGDRKLAFCILKLTGLHKPSHFNGRNILVRYLDTNGVFTGYRRLDPHAYRSKVHGDIIGKIGDLADLNAGSRLQLVTCYGRTSANIGYRS